jgi:RsiW-degrading membrane proteinase PrsW (M82 family)
MKTFFYLVVWVLIIISFWKIFEKAGKPGWASIIPVYNIIILLEIIGKPWWWLLLLLIPGVNIIFGIWMFNLLSISFGKNEGFTVGLVLLPFIFLPILGFGEDSYKGPAGIK